MRLLGWNREQLAEIEEYDRLWSNVNYVVLTPDKRDHVHVIKGVPATLTVYSNDMQHVYVR